MGKKGTGGARGGGGSWPKGGKEGGGGGQGMNEINTAFDRPRGSMRVSLAINAYCPFQVSGGLDPAIRLGAAKSCATPDVNLPYPALLTMAVV